MVLGSSNIFVIFIILVYGTTLVYKEVKKSENENYDENEELDIQQDDNTQIGYCNKARFIVI